MSRRRRTLLASAALLAMSTMACAALSEDVEEQEAAHREGDPTYAQYPWLWANDTEEEFVELSTARYSRPPFLSTAHPMAQRLQFWVDRFDEALRARNPEAMRVVPKPRIIIYKQAQPNAWTTGAPVAWKVPTELWREPPAPIEAGAGEDGGEDGGAGQQPSRPEVVSRSPFLLRREGLVAAMDEGKWYEREHDDRALEQLVSYAREGFATCRLAFEDGTLSIGKECIGKNPPGWRLSRYVAVPAMSTWVTVTTGLITSMLDEDRLVAVLAHELGHYYRAHSFMPMEVTSYFYSLDEPRTRSKPAPDPRHMELTLQVRKKLRDAPLMWFFPQDYSEENARMVEHHLGFYTDEQEADELSLEILARIGLPPSLGLDAQLLLQKITEDGVRDWGRLDTGDLRWAECSALREQGWRDDTGRLVSVPVGNLADPHHSFCFRVFNMALDLQAHRYTVDVERPRPPGEDWPTLLQQLANEVSPPPVVTPDAGLADASTDGDGGVDAGTD